ncbi:MAG: hypothetical protein ACRD2T_05135, partial [Thermoanaerobaculia bacterium]
PWYTPFASSGSEWSIRLREALAAGRIARSEIERDVEEGLSCPSILYRLDHGIDDPLRLPASVLDLDRSFEPPEMAVPAEELDRLRSREFAARLRGLRLRNRLQGKGKPRAVYSSLREMIASPLRRLRRLKRHWLNLP